MSQLKTFVFTILIFIFVLDSAWAQCDQQAQHSAQRVESALLQVNSQEEQKCASKPQNLVTVGKWVNTCTNQQVERKACLDQEASGSQYAAIP